MKNYFPGLTAIILGIAFSAFTKPYYQVDFKLINDPVSAGIVSEPEQWSDFTTGTYGRCDDVPVKIACKITVNSSTMSSYYHTNVDGDLFLKI